MDAVFEACGINFETEAVDKKEEDYPWIPKSHITTTHFESLPDKLGDYKNDLVTIYNDIYTRFSSRMLFACIKFDRVPDTEAKINKIEETIKNLQKYLYAKDVEIGNAKFPVGAKPNQHTVNRLEEEKKKINGDLKQTKKQLRIAEDELKNGLYISCSLCKKIYKNNDWRYICTAETNLDPIYTPYYEVKEHKDLRIEHFLRARGPRLLNLKIRIIVDDDIPKYLRTKYNELRSKIHESLPKLREAGILNPTSAAAAIKAAAAPYYEWVGYPWKRSDWYDGYNFCGYSECEYCYKRWAYQWDEYNMANSITHIKSLMDKESTDLEPLQTAQFREKWVDQIIKRRETIGAIAKEAIRNGSENYQKYHNTLTIQELKTKSETLETAFRNKEIIALTQAISEAKTLIQKYIPVEKIAQRDFDDFIFIKKWREITGDFKNFIEIIALSEELKASIIYQSSQRMLPAYKCIINSNSFSGLSMHARSAAVVVAAAAAATKGALPAVVGVPSWAVPQPWEAAAAAAAGAAAPPAWSWSSSHADGFKALMSFLMLHSNKDLPIQPLLVHNLLKNNTMEPPHKDPQPVTATDSWSTYCEKKKAYYFFQVEDVKNIANKVNRLVKIYVQKLQSEEDTVPYSKMMLQIATPVKSDGTPFMIDPIVDGPPKSYERMIKDKEHTIYVKYGYSVKKKVINVTGEPDKVIYIGVVSCRILLSGLRDMSNNIFLSSPEFTALAEWQTEANYSDVIIKDVCPPLYKPNTDTYKKYIRYIEDILEGKRATGASWNPDSSVEIVSSIEEGKISSCEVWSKPVIHPVIDSIPYLKTHLKCHDKDSSGNYTKYSVGKLINEHRADFEQGLAIYIVFSTPNGNASHADMLIWYNGVFYGLGGATDSSEYEDTMLDYKGEVIRKSPSTDSSDNNYLIQSPDSKQVCKQSFFLKKVTVTKPFGITDTRKKEVDDYWGLGALLGLTRKSLTPDTQLGVRQHYILTAGILQHGHLNKMKEVLTSVNKYTQNYADLIEGSKQNINVFMNKFTMPFRYFTKSFYDKELAINAQVDTLRLNCITLLETFFADFKCSRTIALGFGAAPATTNDAEMADAFGSFLIGTCKRVITWQKVKELISLLEVNILDGTQPKGFFSSIPFMEKKPKDYTDDYISNDYLKKMEEDGYLYMQRPSPRKGGRAELPLEDEVCKMSYKDRVDLYKPGSPGITKQKCLSEGGCWSQSKGAKTTNNGQPIPLCYTKKNVSKARLTVKHRIMAPSRGT